MINMNESMKRIIEKGEAWECYKEIDDILHEVISKTKKVRDCIVYDSHGEIEEEKINFDIIMQFVGDWTGYEVNCNELRCEKQKISPSYYSILAERVGGMLSQQYEGNRIVVYILLYDNDLELRFHTFRKDEGLWLDEDLNTYDRPILYWM